MSLSRSLIRPLRRLVGAAALAAALSLAASAAPAQTDPAAYRLVAGDLVDVAILGEAEPWQTRIDLDGALRLPALGRVQAEGMTLDEAEAALKAEFEETELYIAPRVSLSIVAYAPVLVTGTVRAPGQFDYSPALTAEAAAALAGGVALTGTDGTAMSLQASDLAGRLRLVDTDLQSTQVRIARIEAQLEDRDDIAFDPATRLPFLNVDRDLIDHLLSRERAILTEEKQAIAEVAQLRQLELENIERQIELLMERSRVQDDLIRLQQEARDAAEALDARGLRTRMDMARLERDDANLQAQVLDIEAALSAARTRRADIASGITQSRIDRRVGLLEDSARLRTELARLKHSRRTVLEKSFVLGDPSAMALAGDSGLTLVYTIRRRQGGTIERIAAGPGDRVLPGDNLHVDVISETPVSAGAGVASNLGETN